ncbi:hypothetical protein BCR33DRAFT_721792 [Rhizoclosmatium globosum]|uniref:Uncharacterized protein n=1 Tax=Rhizoclosmatium globosum TaxID=329046 RepID=A0A1Y2BQ42_9FUNG|nr:hypothetical protein BCR33DRAFT_721792 [Rhizoclosmatium globosum]|eukprot:ORY36864.1 hypothetical protein BCR33DRAFT_721792 [Rhizoclosmatium globosum]
MKPNVLQTKVGLENPSVMEPVIPSLFFATADPICLPTKDQTFAVQQQIKCPSSSPKAVPELATAVSPNVVPAMHRLHHKKTPDSPLLIVADQVVVNSITTSMPSPTVVPAPSATETTFVKHSTPLVIAETDAATTKTEPVKVTSPIIPEPVVPLCAAKVIVVGFPSPIDVPIQSAATRRKNRPTSTATTFVEASIEDAELLLFVRTEVPLTGPKTKSQTVA